VDYLQYRSKVSAIAIKGALDRINLDPNLVDEVYMGVVQAGTGQAPARQAAIFAGLPNTVACTTIKKYAWNEISNACSKLQCGDAESWLPAVWKT
jgi:acetyl-CoA C-acetyltransferase